MFFSAGTARLLLTSWALEVCYYQVTYRCQSKTMSYPAFEATYTNKASFEAFTVYSWRATPAFPYSLGVRTDSHKTFY